MTLGLFRRLVRSYFRRHFRSVMVQNSEQLAKRTRTVDRVCEPRILVGPDGERAVGRGVCAGVAALRAYRCGGAGKVSDIEARGSVSGGDVDAARCGAVSADVAGRFCRRRTPYGSRHRGGLPIRANRWCSSRDWAHLRCARRRRRCCRWLSSTRSGMSECRRRCCASVCPLRLQRARRRTRRRHNWRLHWRIRWQS